MTVWHWLLNDSFYKCILLRCVAPQSIWCLNQKSWLYTQNIIMKRQKQLQWYDDDSQKWHVCLPSDIVGRYTSVCCKNGRVIQFWLVFEERLRQHSSRKKNQVYWMAFELNIRMCARLLELVWMQFSLHVSNFWFIVKKIEFLKIYTSYDWQFGSVLHYECVPVYWYFQSNSSSYVFWNDHERSWSHPSTCTETAL